LSNISFGLPERKFINHTFMVMALARGLDGAIVNPVDARMMGCITTAEMLMGRHIEPLKQVSNPVIFFLTS